MSICIIRLSKLQIRMSVKLSVSLERMRVATFQFLYLAIATWETGITMPTMLLAPVVIRRQVCKKVGYEWFHFRQLLFRKWNHYNCATLFLIDFSSYANGPNSGSTLSTPDKFGPFITSEELGTGNLKICVAKCNMHFRQDCHFTFLSNSNCYYGNYFNTAPPLPGLPTVEDTVYMQNCEWPNLKVCY